MALHIKSNSIFKFLVLLSAFSISTVAAIFSVTGISSLFSGYYITVGIMMSVLEFGKIVTASFLTRFWFQLTKFIKTYFILSTVILTLITSAGIFGYLSDAYQKTKGNYDIVSKKIELYNKKIEIFNNEQSRYEKQLVSQTNNLNILYNNSNASNRRIDNRIQTNELAISETNLKIGRIQDSISTYEGLKKTEEYNISTGELGPLKYIATIFNTDMDNVVKYFIFMLIFVFDPLALLLFVSLNILSRNGEITQPASSNAEKTTVSDDSEMLFNENEILTEEMLDPEMTVVETNEESKTVSESIETETVDAVSDVVETVYEEKPHQDLIHSSNYKLHTLK